MAAKDEGTKKENWKAQFVFQLQGDKTKISSVHDTSVSKLQSTKLLFGLASIFGFSTSSKDVIMAYLQSAGHRMRDLHVNPVKNLNLIQTSFKNF